MATMAIVEVTHQLEGEEAMGEEIDLWVKTTASSVVARGTGRETALLPVVVVAEVEVVLLTLHVLGLVVVVETALEGTEIGTWRIVMTGDAMEIEIGLRAETTNMAPVIAMSMTGTGLEALRYIINSISERHCYNIFEARRLLLYL